MLRVLAVLEGLDAVRKRPGMYIGTTDSAGPDALPVGDHRQLPSMRLLAGACNHIIVTLHDRWFR